MLVKETLERRRVFTWVLKHLHSLALLGMIRAELTPVPLTPRSTAGTQAKGSAQVPLKDTREVSFALLSSERDTSIPEARTDKSSNGTAQEMPQYRKWPSTTTAS
jgi:hypothetical protein